MSLAITAYVREGIVMAADSRLTLHQHQGQQQQVGPTQVHIQASHLAVGMSDTSRKLFVTPDNIGIATCGDAAIQGVPVAGFIDSFINGLAPSQTPRTPQQVAQGILGFFHGMKPVPNTVFQVAGYNHGGQEIWRVDIAQNALLQVGQNQQGMTWDGETDIILRLLKPVGLQDDKGNWQSMQQYSIQYGFFTIQDAIDCCVYLMKATIDTMRFQTRPKTVGGPIDVLVIYPDRYEWVNQKKLHV
jgi:hypothetical protein